MLDGRADAAVHSAKDLPTERPHQLDIAAIMARRSSTDALIGRRLLDLEDGATVATGSVRRRAQIAEIRPDLNFLELRGNIETRLQKIPDSGSIVMAVSALEVLNLTSHIAEELTQQSSCQRLAKVQSPSNAETTHLKFSKRSLASMMKPPQPK